MYSVTTTRNWDTWYVIVNIICDIFKFNFILTSSHPYLFFNQDRRSMTFMGLLVDEDGNLIDYKNDKVLEKNFINKRLKENLEQNFVSFKENYKSWKK